MIIFRLAPAHPITTILSEKFIQISKLIVAVDLQDLEELGIRLPNHPPVILEPAQLCDSCEYVDFNLLVCQRDPHRFDLLVSHLEQIQEAHNQAGNPSWRNIEVRILPRLW